MLCAHGTGAEKGPSNILQEIQRRSYNFRMSCGSLSECAFRNELDASLVLTIRFLWSGFRAVLLRCYFEGMITIVVTRLSSPAPYDRTQTEHDSAALLQYV